MFVSFPAQFPGMGSGTGSPSGNPLLGNPLMAYMAFSGLDFNKMLYASMLSGQMGGAGGLGGGLGGMGLFAPAFLFNAIN